MGPVRPGAPGVTGHRRRPRPRPVPAVQGARPGRLLRGARGQGVHPRVVAGGLRFGLLAARVPPGSQPHPRRGDRERVGDAELDEGSNSEAIVYAGAVGLPNLTVVAVDNRSSSYGWGPGGIEAHFTVSGWSSVRVSGRDQAALASAFRLTSAGADSGSAGPQLVVATVEGKG